MQPHPSLWISTRMSVLHPMQLSFLILIGLCKTDPASIVAGTSVKNTGPFWSRFSLDELVRDVDDEHKRG